MPFQETSDGIKLYYRDWGAGAPIVLIHGWPLSGDMWDKQAEYLASHGCRVITYDRRGFGRSCQPWSGYDYDTFAADLHALMEGLDLRDAFLVGFSMGGGEVARYLSRYGSQRVSKAALISAVTPFLLATDDNPDGIPREEFTKMEAAIREDRAAFMKDFAHKFYGRSLISRGVSDAVLEWNQVVAMQASLRSTLAAAGAWSSTDFREDLRKMQVPTLVLHGTHDQTVPIEKSAMKAIRILPQATYVEYDDEPHGLFFTAVDRLNDDLLHFARSGTVQVRAKRVEAPAVLF
ncbi:MAG: alpha/beta hydrolase [Acidobacteria bacterium]|nr:alpha/beta hydrolase [Acidobacteriota bacterium]